METTIGGNSKLLAAYRLGLLSWEGALCYELFLEKPEFEWGTADGVHSTIVELNAALIALAVEFPVNVYGELRAYLEEHAKRWMAILRMVQEFHTGNRPWNSQEIADAGGDPSGHIRKYLNVAFAVLPSLNPWFVFGCNIGEYELAISRHDASLPMPDIDGIVTAARSLPAEWLSSVPILRALGNPANECAAANPRAFLTRVVEATGKTLDRGCFEASIYDSFVTVNLIRLVDQIIQEAIRDTPGMQLVTVENATTSGVLKPRWVKRRDEFWIGELKLGEQVIRKVRSVANNIVLVLDSFEESDWPEFVFDPLPGGEQQRRHETIHSLNEGLQTIEFFGDGANESIGWRFRKPAPTSKTPPRHAH
jgi:hypothetical protein